MSGYTVPDFLDYWRKEGESYAKHGDYDWMASLIPGKRILEIGCGLGFGTLALARRGVAVLAVDSMTECLEATRERLAAVPDADVTLLETDITAMSGATRGAIEAFAPDAVACWLMGAPSEVTGAGGPDGNQAVVAYREKIHRLAAELAAGIPSVKALHLVDRTAIPWQAKDIGRDTLVGYHLGKTFADLPFKADRKNALYRKLEGAEPGLAGLRRTHPSLKSVVPTLASLVAERNH